MNSLVTSRLNQGLTYVPLSPIFPSHDWSPLRVYSLSPHVTGLPWGYILSPNLGGAGPTSMRARSMASSGRSLGLYFHPGSDPSNGKPSTLLSGAPA
eukprot:167961-Prorocentrum_minimum.AAC.1